MPDTYADAHVVNTAKEAGAAANHAATNKNTRYGQLYNIHVFVQVAIETEGRPTWHHQAVELVQEFGRRTANITGDARESNFLFQQLSVALQRGECGLISKHVLRQLARCNPLFHFLCAGGPKNNNCNNSNRTYISP